MAHGVEEAVSGERLAERNHKTTKTTTTTYLILLYTARPPVLYRHLIGIAKDLKRSLTVMHLCRSLLLAAL